MKQDIPGQIFSAEKGRAYSLVVLIILVIVCWPAAIIYYLTRPKQTFSVQIQTAPNGTYVSATADGEKAQAALGSFTSGLTLAETGGAPAPQF